jgi:hypothetical protein
VRTVSRVAQGEVAAIDGRQVRGSKHLPGGKVAICMVSAWASEDEMALGQRKVDGHPNEITAIPELLDLLWLKGCIVTIDAIGCQTEIADKVIQPREDHSCRP